MCSQLEISVQLLMISMISNVQSYPYKTTHDPVCSQVNKQLLNSQQTNYHQNFSLSDNWKKQWISGLHKVTLHHKQIPKRAKKSALGYTKLSHDCVNVLHKHTTAIEKLNLRNKLNTIITNQSSNIIGV